MSKDSSKNRVYGLDVLRAIAILIVVHVHGAWMLQGSFLEKFPWIPLVDGVELFFVLSGFLIGGILLRMIRKNEGSFSFKLVLQFWKRRWFRTLPNYYLILFINILFAYLHFNGNDYHQFNWKFILFLQNFSWPFHSFFWESWSLTIEEWFYILLPLGFFTSLPFLKEKKAILSIILLLLFAPLFFRLLQSGHKVDGYGWDVLFRKVVVMRLDAIIYGVLAAYIHFYHIKFWQKYARLFFVFGLIIIIGIGFVPMAPNDFFVKTFYFSIISFGAMCLLPAAEMTRSYKGQIGKMITHISLISYSMYLVNLGLVSQVIKKHFTPESPQEGILKYFLYWFIVIGVSSLLYAYFERPLMNLRDRKLFPFLKPGNRKANPAQNSIEQADKKTV